MYLLRAIDVNINGNKQGNIKMFFFSDKQDYISPVTELR